MAEKITVTPAELEKAASAIDGLAADYQTQYNNLYSETTNMKTAWQGRDNVAYINQIEGFKDDFAKMQTLMKNYADFLKKSAAAYRRTQEEITNRATKLRN